MKTQKIALVTGVTRGIGKAVASKLLNSGYTVVGTYNKNKKIADKLSSSNNQLIILQANVGNEKDIVRIVKYIKKHFGVLDVLINNVGVDIFHPIREYKSKDWDTVMNVNLKSVFLFSKLCIPLLEKTKDGVIVNITSRLGMPERVLPPFIVYCVSKAGVTAFTTGLAKELKNLNIRVNAVVPTATETDLLRLVAPKEIIEQMRAEGNLGQPEEAADLIMQLVQDSTANGQILFDKRVKK